MHVCVHVCVHVRVCVSHPRAAARLVRMFAVLWLDPLLCTIWLLCLLLSGLDISVVKLNGEWSTFGCSTVWLSRRAMRRRVCSATCIMVSGSLALLLRASSLSSALLGTNGATGTIRIPSWVLAVLSIPVLSPFGETGQAPPANACEDVSAVGSLIGPGLTAASLARGEPSCVSGASLCCTGSNISRCLRGDTGWPVSLLVRCLSRDEFRDVVVVVSAVLCDMLLLFFASTARCRSEAVRCTPGDGPGALLL